MKRRTIIVLISFFILFFVWQLKKQFVLGNDIEIKSSPVFAITKDLCEVYYNLDMKNSITTINKGEYVEILEDKGEEKYLIKSSKNNLKGWVFAKFLDIPKTPNTNKNKLKNYEIENYINENGFDSKTNHLVFTDIDRQLTYILKGKLNNWKLEKIIVCATGKNTSPTTRGTFFIKDKGEWFYSERLKSGAKYWVRFNNCYLFHSIPMDKNKNILDNRLGERCSSGCIRMSLEDIKWFYDNIEYGTTVFIN